jgi:hypothetical protein
MPWGDPSVDFGAIGSGRRQKLRLKNKMNRWNDCPIGLIAQTRKNSLKMRANGELMLRNAKFYHFVTR